MRILRHIWKQAPVIALLLLFFGGWLTVPLALVLPEPVTCGMECCEESGECCCFLMRQALRPEGDETDNEPQLVALGKSCELNCATPPTSNNLSFAQKTLLPSVRGEISGQDERLIHQPINPLSLVLCRRSSPRAPPFHLG